MSVTATRLAVLAGKDDIFTEVGSQVDPSAENV